MRAAILGCVIVLLAGCGHVRGFTWEAQSLQVGPGAPPKSPTCPVRQEFLSPREAQDRYRQVGVICHVGGWYRSQVVRPAQPVAPSNGSWAGLDAQTVQRPAAARPPIQQPPTLLDDVREDACRLGGEIIVRHGFCNLPPGRGFGGGSGVELGVYEVKATTTTVAVD